MAKAAGGGLLRNGQEGLRNGEVQSVEGTGFERSEGLLDDGPASLDWIEIRRVRWKVEKLGSGCGNGLCNALYFVRRKIIHHYNLSRPQGRAQDFVEKSQKHFTVCGCGYGHGGLPALATDGTQHCHGSPVSTGRSLVDTPTARGAAVAPRHVRRNAAFIKENQALGWDASQKLPPCGSLLLALFRVLFSGVQTFFYGAIPSPARQRISAER